MQNLLPQEYNNDLRVTYQLVTSSTPDALVQQYFTLRQKVYTDYWKLENFFGGEDEYDKVGNILLALQGNKCVGGIRLIMHKANTSQRLPMETHDFDLIKLFPELKLQEENYGEISRGVLLPEFMNGKYSMEVYRNIAMRSKYLQHKYAFAIATASHARRTRIACKAFGLNVGICKDIVVPPLPTYEGLEMRLLIIHIGEWDMAAQNIQETEEACLVPA